MIAARATRKAVAVILGALVVGGCADSSDDQQIVRKDVNAKALASGRLDRDPRLLNVNDVDRTPDGSAQEAVIELFFYGQWGSAPGVVDAYAPGIIDVLGLDNIAGSYNYVRYQLAHSAFRIVETRRKGTLMFVGVELTSRLFDMQRDSFLLRRFDGEWKIVYDTMLQRAIEAYVPVREARNPDQKPDAAAKRRAAQTAVQYRQAYNSIYAPATKR